MHPANIIIIFIVIGIIYVLLPLTYGPIQKGGNVELNFSEITDDISSGNPISWSNIKNTAGRTKNT